MVVTASEYVVANPAPSRREADIELLKRLRAQTVTMVAESRAFSFELSADFAKLRASIENSLAFALLARELGQ